MEKSSRYYTTLTSKTSSSINSLRNGSPALDLGSETPASSTTSNKMLNVPFSQYISFQHFKIINGRENMAQYVKDVPYLPIFQYPQEITNTEGISRWKQIYRKGKFILKYYFYGIKNILVYVKNNKVMSGNHKNLEQDTKDLVKKIEFKLMEIAQEEQRNSAEASENLSSKQLSTINEHVFAPSKLLSSRRLFEQRSMHFLNGDLLRFVWFSGLVFVFEELAILLFLFCIPSRWKHKVIPYNCNIPELLALQTNANLQIFHTRVLKNFEKDYLANDYLSPPKLVLELEKGGAGTRSVSSTTLVPQINEAYMKYIYLDDLLILREMLESQPDVPVVWYKEELVQKCCERFLLRSLSSEELDVVKLQETLCAYLRGKYALDLDVNKSFGIWNVYTLGRIPAEYKKH
ncbi:hypothetical protein ACO0QE_002346 [Hanseniaspora vineae]